jgi:hypothetical protein
VAYNIHLQEEDGEAFFGTAGLPLPPNELEILNTEEARVMAEDRSAELIGLLDLTKKRSFMESEVDNFTLELLKCLGYAKRPRLASTRMLTIYYIGGEWGQEETDAYIVDHTENDILLLVQEDKRYEINHRHDSCPQLIATFEYNNRQRTVVEQVVFESR